MFFKRPRAVLHLVVTEMTHCGDADCECQRFPYVVRFQSRVPPFALPALLRSVAGYLGEQLDSSDPQRLIVRRVR